MVDAAAAVFFLVVVQVAQTWVQIDWHVGPFVVFVDRLVLVSGLAFFAGWLTVKAKSPGWAMHLMGASAVLALAAVPFDRSLAMPMVWLLQIAILIGLATWLLSVVGDRWPFVFLCIATGAHAIGSLTYFPMCQLAVPGEWIISPNATYICDEVFGPVWGSGAFFGGVALVWAIALGGAAWAGRATAGGR